MKFVQCKESIETVRFKQILLLECGQAPAVSTLNRMMESIMKQVVPKNSGQSQIVGLSEENDYELLRKMSKSIEIAQIDDFESLIQILKHFFKLGKHARKNVKYKNFFQIFFGKFFLKKI